jgi:sortase A
VLRIYAAVYALNLVALALAGVVPPAGGVQDSVHGAVPVEPATMAVGRAAAVDFSDWSAVRVKAYREALAVRSPAAIAVLTISRLRLQAPIFEGTDDLTLNRGLGRIAGTSQPGEDGNLGVAGHRDGFFRPLKDIRVGDTIDVAATDGTATYAVKQIEIVNPEDVRVLLPGATPSLTLVTCYPFYFAGHAPKRYIVEAMLLRRSPAAKP